MLTRTIALFAFGAAAVLFGASQTEAQPGKGGKGGSFGKGPGAGSGPDVQKLERDLERLLEQIQDTKAQLARAKEAGKGKGGFQGQKGPQGQFDGKGKKGFEGKGFDKGDFMKKKDDFFKKKGDPKKEAGKPGFPPFGGKGFEAKGGKLDPDTIREKYEFYKKLYDELPKAKGKGLEGKGKGKGRGFESKKSEPTPPTPPTPPMPFGKGQFGRWGGFGGPSAAPSRSVESRIDALIRELEQLRNEVKGSKK